jgi:hypothetical protein
VAALRIDPGVEPAAADGNSDARLADTYGDPAKHFDTPLEPEAHSCYIDGLALAPLERKAVIEPAALLPESPQQLERIDAKCFRYIQKFDLFHRRAQGLRECAASLSALYPKQSFLNLGNHPPKPTVPQSAYEHSKNIVRFRSLSVPLQPAFRNSVNFV